MVRVVLNTVYLVSEKLNEGDRQILMEEGVSLPSRKRKWKYKEEEEGKREEMEQKHKETLEWHNVRKLLDPNPQLRGVDPGRYAHKVKERLNLN